MFTMISKYFTTFSYKPRPSWVTHWTRYFLHVSSVCVIVPCENRSFWNPRKNSLPVRDLAMSYKLFCLRFCVSSDQWKSTVKQRLYKEFERHFYMKIIVTIILTNLVTNLLLSLFCPLVETKNNNPIFSKLVVW